MPEVQPIFVLSLPRSGSTLLQRILAAHDGVATASEPWLLLPLLGPLRERMPHAGAWQPLVRDNLEDFARLLPGGVADYERVVRDAALELYSAASPAGTRWFVDKTPPYYLLPDQLMQVFPEARFVFLWRHPLSVVASMAETFTNGRWRPGDHVTALFAGLENLVAAARTADERSVSLRFEDVVDGTPDTWRRVLDPLGIPFAPAALEGFQSVRLEGRMGDPTGIHRYRTLSTEPVAKWRSFVVNPLRREWARRYVRWIGTERLEFMGYDLDAILSELEEMEVGRTGLAADAVQLSFAVARDIAKAQVVRPRPPTSFRYLLGAQRTR